MDEIGTPFCVTIDGETLQDQTVTIRDRDTMSQNRVGLDKVLPYLRERLVDRRTGPTSDNLAGRAADHA